MTHFPEDASTTLRIVRVPVVRIETTRKHAIGCRLWARGRREAAFQLCARGGKAPVEADVETAPALGEGVINLLKLAARQAEGLLDEYMAIRE